MTRARLALTVAALAAVTVALAGCEKPNPGASVYSGTTTQYRQAACWSADGSIDATACAQAVLAKAKDGVTIATVPAVPGQVIGISVDPVVADAGWYPRINGQNITQSPITSTYYRFTFPDFQEVSKDGIALEVVAGAADATKGIWLFQLVPGNA